MRELEVFDNIKLSRVVTLTVVDKHYKQNFHEAEFDESTLNQLAQSMPE